MEHLVDLAEIRRIIGRRGERAVILVPGQEPIVLMTLSEYEQLPPTAAKPSAKPGKPNAPQAQISAKPKPAEPDALERIDPPQGALSDDDQYYPEPLE